MSRTKRIVAAVAVGVLVATLCARAILARRGARSLEVALDRIRQDGGPLDTLALRPPAASEQENAAPALRQAFARLVQPADDAVRNALDDDDWEKARTDGEFRGTAAELVAAVDAHLDSSSRTIALLESAVDRPRCNFDLRYEGGLEIPMPHLMQFVDAARLLHVRARRQAERGEASQAARTIAIGLELPRHLAEDPFVIGHFVRLAGERQALDALERVLATTRLDERDCRALIAVLATLRRGGEIAKVLAGERAMDREYFTRVREGHWKSPPLPDAPSDFSRSPIHDEIPGYRRRLAFCPWLLDEDEATFLELTSALIEASRKPFPAALAAAKEVKEQLRSLPERRVVTRFAADGSIVNLLDAEARLEAKRRVATVALALEIHARRLGRLPETLDVLVPGVLRALPEDPFNGKPLVYKLENGGYVLYSVGADETDDGGPRIPNKEDYRDDVGFRVRRD